MLKIRDRELDLVSDVNAALSRMSMVYKLLEDMRGEGILATAKVAELEQELCNYIAALNDRISGLPR